MLTGVGFMVAIHFMGDNVSGGGGKDNTFGQQKDKEENNRRLKGYCV